MRIHAYLDFLYMTRNLRDLVLWVTADFISAMGIVTTVYLLAERFGRIGVWGKEQLLFLLGYVVLQSALVELFFGFNVAWISRRIGRGQLDHVLIQPQPIWRALATEGFVPFSAVWQLAPGIVVMAWAGSRLPVVIDAGWWALLLFSIAASLTVVLAFSYAWGSMAFWAPVAAEEISTRAMSLIEELRPFPLDGMGRGLVGGLLFIVPSGFAAWYPCRYLTGVAPMGWEAGGTVLAAVGFGLLVAAVFGKGMKRYARTGSQRYLSFGHRR